MCVDPQTLHASVDVTFELVDGEVRIDYVDEGSLFMWRDYLSELVHPEGRLVKPSEGDAYWALLDITFRQSTFVYVDIEPELPPDVER
jgi:hypothetical protein